jgi:cathepsin B
MVIVILFLTVSSLFCWSNLKNLVREINSRNDIDWVAGVNERFEDMSLETFRSMNGARSILNSTSISLPVISHSLSNADVTLPLEYDVRSEYAESCPLMQVVYDQGHCGSCWAFAVFESLQDRICIRSGGKYSVELSAQYLTSCDTSSNGCQGFLLIKLFKLL